MTETSPLARTVTGAALLSILDAPDLSQDLELLDRHELAPGSTREPQASPSGFEVLAFGPHTPGDGETVAAR